MYENWRTLSLAEQMGNVGSDYERALRWKAKGQETLFVNALARTLEQLDLTLADARWAGTRRREIARAREEVCQEVMYQDEPESAERLAKYFLAFAWAARRQAGL